MAENTAQLSAVSRSRSFALSQEGFAALALKTPWSRGYFVVLVTVSGLPMIEIAEEMHLGWQGGE